MAHREVTIDSVRRSLMKGEWVIVLKQEQEEEYLPIFVGTSAANIVKRELMGVPYPDSDTYERFLTGSDMVGLDLENVVIDGPEKDSFQAKLFLSKGSRSIIIDCPVAGALALGYRRKANILVNEQSFLEAGITLPN
jgi:uncharacterized protein